MPRTLLASFLAAIAAGVPAAEGAEPRATWPQFRFDSAHTGFNPAEHSLSPTNVRRLRKAWTFSTEEPIWSSAAVVDGVVYIGANDQRVYALRASNGRRLWATPVGGRPSAPAVVGSTVYVFADDATLYALRASDGRRLWATVVSTLEGGFPAAATVAGGVVYTMVGEITAVAATGRILWQRQIGCFGCPVTVVGKTAYIAAQADVDPIPPPRLYALDTATGTTRWSKLLTGRYVDWTPTVTRGTVYLISHSERRGIKTYSFEAHAAATGRRLWRVPVGQSRVDTFSSAAVAQGLVVVPSPSGYLYALRAATGAAVWRAPLEPTDSAPAIANGVVYIGSGNGRLYAFALASGKELWSASLGKAVTSSPSLVNGTVYVGTDAGAVVAFRRA